MQYSSAQHLKIAQETEREMFREKDPERKQLLKESAIRFRIVARLAGQNEAKQSQDQ